MSLTSGDLVDRTRELSFERPDRACTSKLLETGVIVVKKAFTQAQLEAASRPYMRRNTVILPRRIAAKVVEKTIGRESELYRAVHPGYVRGHPQNLPRYMAPARPVVEGLVALNDALYEDRRLIDRYQGKTVLNLAGIQRSSPRTNKAFPRHQDSQGVTGLGYATQGQPTKWNIFSVPEPGDDPLLAYSFFTGVGDTVVLVERAGPCPDYISPRQGKNTYSQDGSVIHEGWNLAYGVARYAIVGFCEELPEGIHKSKP